MLLYIIIGAIFIFIILYFIAIMPRMIHRPQRDHFIGKYYAHRGFHDNKSNAPENSLNSFRRAVEEGYGIELDVQLTKDKVLVVFHDYSLNRVCGVDKKIKDYSFEELKQFKLYQSDQQIPKFTEVLKLIDGKVPLIVELKVEWDAALTCEKVNKVLQKYKGKYCIESFSPLALIWFRKNNPNIIRGQLATNFIKEKENGNKKIYLALQNLLLNFLTKPDFIAFDFRYCNKLSFILATKLYRAFPVAWTIQTQEDLERSRSSYVSYIFDSFSPKG